MANFRHQMPSFNGNFHTKIEKGVARCEKQGGLSYNNQAL